LDIGFSREHRFLCRFVDGGGFPANLQATMIVDAKYTAPATREFTVVT
jgi:hypothetical protein